MKPIILRKMMPVAVFVLGISGAFLTTSMQSSAKAYDSHIFGYVDELDDDQPCDIQVSCDNEVGDICRLTEDDLSPVAKAMDSPTTCAQTVYRPK